MPLELDDETRQALLHGIQRYFRDERGEEIGELQAGFLLDFVLAEVGPSVYNQAVRDVQAHLARVNDDLAATLYQPEFGYSTQARSRTARGRR